MLLKVGSVVSHLFKHLVKGVSKLKRDNPVKIYLCMLDV